MVAETEPMLESNAFIESLFTSSEQPIESTGDVTIENGQKSSLII